ncbi:hypothetical protein MN608_02862 [Microdochium nivale]|nr:hypothetical protein MN608_02862 [Microdochium nivale]
MIALSACPMRLEQPSHDRLLPSASAANHRVYMMPSCNNGRATGRGNGFLCGIICNWKVSKFGSEAECPSLVPQGTTLEVQSRGNTVHASRSTLRPSRTLEQPRGRCPPHPHHDPDYSFAYLQQLQRHT